METIKEAQDYLNDNFLEGVHCPCCEQYVKKYKRKINSAMARVLIRLNNVTEEQGEDFYHVSVFDPTRSGGSDVAKLAAWGLVKAQVNKDTTKRCSGMWIITEKGKQFARQEINLPKYCWFYNGDVLGLDDEHMTDVVDSLGDKFDYVALMRGEG